MADDGILAPSGIGRKIRFALIDGDKIPPQLAERQGLECRSVVRGDAAHFIIAAASVVAKVLRDRIMVDLGNQYPEYGFEQNKGYGTKAHLEAVKKRGPSKVHRRSFEPITTWFPADYG